MAGRPNQASTIFVNKVYLNTAMVIVYLLSISAFAL